LVPYDLATNPDILWAELCGSRKYPFPHHRGPLEISRGGGVLKAKIFKGKYEPKLEFPEEVGAQTKKSPMGGVLIFSGTAHCLTSSKDVCIGCHL